jgi:hypothetical protein
MQSRSECLIHKIYLAGGTEGFGDGLVFFVSGNPDIVIPLRFSKR